MNDPRRMPKTNRVVANCWAKDYPDLTPVQPQPHMIAAECVDLALHYGKNRDRQLIYGEAFDVLEWRDGYAFGIAPARDHVGWVATEALQAAPMNDKLQWVKTRQTHAYCEPDFKSAEVAALSHLSVVYPNETSGKFTHTELGWVPSTHLTDRPETDIITQAVLYLGTPYLWGGNSCWGIDCSGLVQAACLAIGQNCPADSDQQKDMLGINVSDDYQRGDLLFWKGHVALVVNAEQIIHANAHHMAVVYEGLHDALRRIEQQGDGPVTAHKRLK